MNTVYIGSDHGGFAGKEHLKVWLTERGEQVIDLGPVTLDPADDYPIFAGAVAHQISQHPDALGILLCRSGAGVAIVANKYPAVRAAVAWDEQSAQSARSDDVANIICLPSDRLDTDQLERIVATFLATLPETDERFTRRLAEITRIEEQTMHRRA